MISVPPNWSEKGINKTKIQMEKFGNYKQEKHAQTAKKEKNKKPNPDVSGNTSKKKITKQRN